VLIRWLWPAVARPDPEVGRSAGAEMAGALDDALDRAELALEAHRCALLDPAPAGAPRPLPATARPFTVQGDTLSAAGGRPLVIAVVADARGATPPTLARIAALRAELEGADVELVLSLGGLGTGRAEIAAVLRALDGPWAVLAIPGDRESVAEHAAAVAELAAAGKPVVDGAKVRFVDGGGAAIGTFPGAGHTRQLVGGPDGCQHDAGDAAALAQALAGRPGVRVWAGWSAPRQRGPGGSDLGGDGVHAGERALAAALAGRPIALVLSAMVDDGVQEDGEASPGGDRLHLSAGSLEAVPGSTSSALLLTVEKIRIKWRLLRVN
jgi:hypothetical protein